MESVREYCLHVVSSTEEEDREPHAGARLWEKASDLDDMFR